MTQVVADDFSEVTRIPLFGIPLEKLPSYRKVEPVGSNPTVVEEKINIGLLREIMTFIKDHPTTWYQDSWFHVVDRKTGEATYAVETQLVEEVNSCGTSFCFAGHVGLAQGFPSPPKDNSQSWERNVDGEWYPEQVEDFARARLGLSHGQADALFDANNSMKDLERMVQTLILIPTIEGHKLESIQYNIEDDDDTAFMEFLLTQAARLNHK